MSARKSKVVKVNISAGTYKDEAEAVREANAIKRWLIRYCEKNGYSIKGKVWISTNSAYAGRIINKGRKKEYKPNGKPLPTVVEAHIHMVLFCNPASTIVDALKSYLNKKHMKAVVWDRHCNSRAEVENAVEYAMRQSRKVRTIDYDRKDVLSVDEWGYYEAVEKAEAKIKNNMAFTKTEPEHTPEALENKSVSSISDTPKTLTYKSIKHNYLYYIVPTFYNRSIIKALLQNVIYYGRESSRRCCSKNIIKKVLLKAPLLLKNIRLCGIIIMCNMERLLEITKGIYIMGNLLITPILKWVGGKRQLLDSIIPLINKNYSTYVEPFIGGGAVFFELQPKKAIINDYNEELINVYLTIRDYPDELIAELEKHKENNTEEYFYTIRALDRDSQYENLSSIERAARIIYLNKTCYNGLYRVNSAGQFNAPYGKYKNPNIVNATTIKAMSKYLKSDKIDIRQGDYRDALKGLRKGAFVYLDPPYMPISSSSSFTGYTEGGFSYEKQVELKLECDKLKAKGISFLQSNSDCPEIRELYKDYEIITVQAKRSINSDASKRGEISEVLIYYVANSK